MHAHLPCFLAYGPVVVVVVVVAADVRWNCACVIRVAWNTAWKVFLNVKQEHPRDRVIARLPSQVDLRLLVATRCHLCGVLGFSLGRGMRDRWHREGPQ